MTTRRSDVTSLQELPPTITVEQAGEVLGISRRSAYRAAASGELPTLRLGRRLLVPTPRLLGLLGVTIAASGDKVDDTSATKLRPSA
jgi:excisionase family DNA binding protein